MQVKQAMSKVFLIYLAK